MALISTYWGPVRCCVTTLGPDRKRTDALRLGNIPTHQRFNHLKEKSQNLINQFRNNNQFNLLQIRTLMSSLNNYSVT